MEEEEITYQLVIDGGAPVSVGTRTTYDSLLLSPGQHTITVIGKCSHGFTNSDTATVTVPEPCHINDTDIEYNMNNALYKISWTITNAYAVNENMFFSLSIDDEKAFETDATVFDFSSLEPGKHSIQINVSHCSHNNSTELQRFDYTLIDPINSVKPLLQSQFTSLENSKLFNYSIQLPEVTESTNYAKDTFKHYLVLDDTNTTELTTLTGSQKFYDLGIGLHKLNLVTTCEHGQTKYIQNTFNITGVLYNGYYYTADADASQIFLFNNDGQAFFAKNPKTSVQNAFTSYMCSVIDNMIYVKDWDTLSIFEVYRIVDDQKIQKFAQDVYGNYYVSNTYHQTGNIRTVNGEILYEQLNAKNFNGPNVTYFNVDDDAITITFEKSAYVSSTIHSDWPITFQPMIAMSNTNGTTWSCGPTNPTLGTITETDTSITYKYYHRYIDDGTTIVVECSHITPLWYVTYPGSSRADGVIWCSPYEVNVKFVNWCQLYQLNPDGYTEMQYLPDIINKYSYADKIAIVLRHSENYSGDWSNMLTQNGVFYSKSTAQDIEVTHLLNVDNTVLFADQTGQTTETAKYIGNVIFNVDDPPIWYKSGLLPTYTDSTNWPTIAAYPERFIDKNTRTKKSITACQSLLNSIINGKKFNITIGYDYNILPFVKWASNDLIRFDFHGNAGDPWLCYLAGVAIIQTGNTIITIPVYTINTYATGAEITVGDNGYHGVMRDMDNDGYGNILHTNFPEPEPEPEPEPVIPDEPVIEPVEPPAENQPDIVQ